VEFVWADTCPKVQELLDGRDTWGRVPAALTSSKAVLAAAGNSHGAALLPDRKTIVSW
jgi:hypothetical protein